MTILIVSVFLLGYFLIALEHRFRLNKAAIALLTGVLCWTFYLTTVPGHETGIGQLMHHLGDISSMLFFLLGAMTIVEIIDSHQGFGLLTARINTRSKTKLLWLVALFTFVLSSLLDNLTTAIVATSLVGRLLSDRNDRLWFVGIIVIAANAGGAFSPLGDVTTTMLWIGGQVSASSIIGHLIVPSLVACVVPLALVTPRFRHQTFHTDARAPLENRRNSVIVLSVGIALILLVPVFKVVTHLPPFMGMMLSLGILWIVVSRLHAGGSPEERHDHMVVRALQRIDTPSILFFLGILLAVAALQSSGILKDLAGWLDHAIGNTYVIGAVLGLVSSIVDNVPLVSAAQRMYSLSVFPMDHSFWTFLALTTGTGGSAIIIGSAAGVAAMGIEKIEFMWYLKRITILAVAGFGVGIAVFLAQTALF